VRTYTLLQERYKVRMIGSKKKHNHNSYYSNMLRYFASVFHRKRNCESCRSKEVVRKEDFDIHVLSPFRKGDLVSVVKKGSSCIHEICVVENPLWGGGPAVKVKTLKSKVCVTRTRIRRLQRTLMHTQEIKAYLPEDLELLDKIELKGEAFDKVKTMRVPFIETRKKMNMKKLKENSFVEVCKEGSSQFGRKARVLNGSWGGDEAVKVMLDGQTRGFHRSEIQPLRSNSVQLYVEDAECIRAFLIVVRYRLNVVFRHSSCVLLLKYIGFDLRRPVHHMPSESPCFSSIGI